MTLGERIAKLRNDAGYSQEYIAEQLEVSRQAVSKWENDLSSPDTENLIKLANILNTSVQFLATGKDFYFPEGKPAREKKKIRTTKKLVIKIITVTIAAVLILLGLIYILVGFFGSVDIDSAACSGGYQSFLFEKYSDELTDMFIDNMGSPRFISSSPAKASFSMNFSGKDI